LQSVIHKYTLSCGWDYQWTAPFQNKMGHTQIWSIQGPMFIKPSFFMCIQHARKLVRRISEKTVVSNERMIMNPEAHRKKQSCPILTYCPNIFLHLIKITKASVRTADRWNQIWSQTFQHKAWILSAILQC
jgi:hypothetical protein